MFRKIIVLVVTLFSITMLKSYAAEQMSVSDTTLDFGYSYAQKEVAITNNGDSALTWHAETDVPWLKVASSQGTIPSQNQVLNNSQYYYSNMWPKLANPWYFNNPQGITVDKNDQVYIADTLNNRVKKFNKYGELIEIIGSDRPADNDYLNEPIHIAIDSENNFYVTGKQGVKKFDASGNFIKALYVPATSTASRNDLYNSYDIAINPNDEIYVTSPADSIKIYKFDKNGGFVWKWGEYGLGNGQFVSSADSEPKIGILCDSKGNVYTADNHYMRIQKFDSNGNFITKWASADGSFDPLTSRTRDYQYGELFAIDLNDTIYVAYEHLESILKFSGSGEKLGEVAYLNKTPYYAGSINYVGDGAVDKNGNIYINTQLDSVIKVNPSGDILSEWKNWERTEGSFYAPTHMAMDSEDNFYIIDEKEGKFRYKSLKVFSPDGEFIKKIDLGDSETIHAFSIDHHDTLYFVKGTYVYTRSRDFQTSSSYGFGGLQGSINKVTFSPDDNAMYFSLYNDGSVSNVLYTACQIPHLAPLITLFSSNIFASGTEIRSFGVAVDNDENTYVLYYGKISGLTSSSRLGVLKFSATGNLLQEFPLDQSNNPNFQWKPYEPRGMRDLRYITTDSTNNVYVLTPWSEVQKFDQEGRFLTKWGKAGSDCSEINRLIMYPFYQSEICIASDNKIYINEPENSRVQVFSQVARPQSIMIDRSLLPALVNTGTITIYNDTDVSQPPVRITVTAKSESIANNPPVPESITPNSGIITTDTLVTFTATYSDKDGAEDIQQCAIVFSNETTSSTLVPFVINSSGTIYAPEDIAKDIIIDTTRTRMYKKDATTVAVDWVFTFKPSFARTVDILLCAADKSATTLSSFVKKGTITIQAPASNILPVTGLVTPDSGTFASGLTQIFKAKYSDENGSGDIRFCELQFWSSVSNVRLLYNTANKTISLRRDDNWYWMGGYAPGANKTVENKYVTLDYARSRVYNEGENTIVVEFALSFKDAFTGAKTIRSAVTEQYDQGRSGRWIGWNDKGSIIITASDTTAPLLTISSPANNAELTYQNVVFSGTANDNSGISEVRVYVYDYAKSSWIVSNALAEYNSTNTQWSYIITQSRLTKGQFFRLWVRAKDNNGNLCSWQNRLIYIASDTPITPSSLRAAIRRINAVRQTAPF